MRSVRTLLRRAVVAPTTTTTTTTTTTIPLLSFPLHSTRVTTSRHGHCAPFSTEIPPKIWKVYLSGEIHTHWRMEIAQGVASRQLPVQLSGPNTSHEDSDDCGAILLGMQEERANWDRLGATMNQIRTQTLLKEADVVVVKFGDKYRQWNAAFDAGFAAALGKSLIVLHDPPSLSHMLKEVNASAQVVCAEPQQVVDTLDYVITGRLPDVPRDGDAFVPIAHRLGKGNPNP